MSEAEVAATIDLDDVQGNILRGYRHTNARHWALRVRRPAEARALLGAVVSGNDDRAPQLTTAGDWGKERPPYCTSLGITFDGLAALGVPESILTRFPTPFRQGPAARAEMLGDIGPSAPEGWELGGPNNPAAHLIVSLHTSEADRPLREPMSAWLRELFGEHGLIEVWCRDTNALPDGKVHFGYRDGIGQPNVAGAGTPEGRRIRDMQPDALTGDFLLGKDYENQYHGNYLGGVPAELGDNASYAAVRLLEQNVQAFETFIQLTGKRHNMDPELVAAKLVGRWRNGTPLVLSPERPDPDSGPIPKEDLDNFDYAPSAEHPTYLDDRDGIRCPVGSHIRRLNPRSGLAMGKGHSRRIIRRGMPYGPAYDPEEDAGDDGVERGLFGYFICGDLEMQYEFILGTWANKSYSAAGMRGTRDPILGVQDESGGKFILRTDDLRDPIVIDNLPQLVTTRGSLYCLLPGVGGLRFLAGA